MISPAGGETEREGRAREGEEKRIRLNIDCKRSHLRINEHSAVVALGAGRRRIDELFPQIELEKGEHDTKSDLWIFGICFIPV